MSIPRQYYERRSVKDYLEVAIQPSGGWTGITFRDGFSSEEEIIPPLVSVTVLPSRFLELQMGRSIGTNKSFTRIFQVDCYMETEPRAMTMADDVADAIDQMHINITDPGGTNLGVIYCPDTEGIIITSIKPTMSDPRVKRWRSVIQAPLEAHYLND